MPYITVESGVLSDTQKEELIKRLTEISSEIMKIPQEFFVTTIKEVPDKNFGIGGKTIDKVKAEYMQTHNKQLQDNLKHRQGKGMENVLITGTTSGIGKAFFIPSPSDAVYSATKAYIMSFSNALYGEYRHTGIKITLLCPR